MDLEWVFVPTPLRKLNPMRNIAVNQDPAIEAIETREWQESLDYVVQRGGGVARAAELLRSSNFTRGRAAIGCRLRPTRPTSTAIPAAQQPAFPGNQALERRIKSLVRWNALAMVVRANKLSDGIGGHISTFASAATLYEVGFNHFFKGQGQGYDGDVIYFQGHAAPGIYARAFLEGRLPVEKLENFRRETQPGGGLSSYPHPWLMPDFWQFPTVSMGLGPDHGDLPGALQALPRRSRPGAARQPQGVGVSRRRRDRRAGVARRHHAGQRARSSTT